MSGEIADLIEQVDSVIDFSSGDDFLQLSKQFFGAKNASYWCSHLPNPPHENYYIHHTYRPEWEQCYFSENLIEIDPILATCMTSITPKDWSDINDGSNAAKKFFGLAREHGLGKQGLSFTVRGRRNETAIFSIDVDLNSNDWQPYKSAHMSDLQIVSTYFHEKVLQSQDEFRDNSLDALSQRELECLKWCIEGKSYWETSVILGISERTVNFHMTTVRQKLNAMSNAQAVATAIIQGLR